MLTFVFTTDKPSPPRNLDISNMSAVSCDVSWEIPEDDGGSPIIHYIVEKKNLSRKMWQVLDKVPELTYGVTNLHDGNQYLFRVSAENAYGVSEPVQITEPVTAKNPYSKSHILYLLTSCRHEKKLLFIFTFVFKGYICHLILE